MAATSSNNQYSRAHYVTMLASLNLLSKSYASILLDRFILGNYGSTKTAKTFISVSFQMTRRLNHAGWYWYSLPVSYTHLTLPTIYSV